jgi:dTMP kinase
MKPGKLITLYGVNNLGKTTQAKLLVDRLNRAGHQAEYLKYPIYDLEPFGPLLNDYLRNGNPENFSAREVQLNFVLNRTQYEPTLNKKLAGGISVVAEDYCGTGIAWGIGAGVDKNFLEEINSHLRREDLAFLFDGERFTGAIENNHHHETNEELTARVREAHLELGQEFGWRKINANLSIIEIEEQIWRIVKETFGL